MGEARLEARVGAALPHESAHLHVSGEARYVDDLPEPRGTLYAAIGMSARAHARVHNLDLAPVRAAPGVASVLSAADIPGDNDAGSMLHDEPIFAGECVEYAGQCLFAVAAASVEQARRAARRAQVEYEELEPVLDADAALARRAFVVPSQTLSRGDARAAIAAARHRLRGRLRIGGQDHFYLEGQIALAVPREDGDMLVYSSTQHPGEVQLVVARALGRRAKDVVVECRRMGGGFGGKETQPALFASIAALLAARTGRPVKLRLDRDDDMLITGKRHPFVVDYDVGFAEDGEIHGLHLTLASICGISADLSGPVNVRAMFHADNCYYLDNVTITSHRCKTNTASNTAFRGFGGPQGMMAIEYVVDEIARHLGTDPLAVRRRNFYGVGERDVTPYGMTVEDNVIADVVDALEAGAEYGRRRREAAAYNARSPYLKRGIALTPVKFGISFTTTHYNQAGALLHVYTDGTVQLNHGGTEMGQGLFTKVAQVVAEELQIDIDHIRCTASDTGKVPNASATAASSGTDLNGMAAQAAARTIKERLAHFAAEHYQARAEEVVFRDGHVHVRGEALAFAELVQRAWKARVPLSATGFYRTPKIHYDQSTLSGRPFYYFAYGAAVAEVVVDLLTGEHRTLRVDILHDAGESINPAIDLGQVEGGFIQGMGWLTTEELWWDAAGELKTHAPSTYKIPVASDLPEQFNVQLLSAARNREATIHRSKAVGEPPLMLAISVFHAIKDAIASVGGGLSPHLDAPATPEAVLRGIEDLRARAASRNPGPGAPTPSEDAP
ncbi:MAG: xanthine dehydrogenase molybdopterin binding subunit [Gammaproteobacteria bacterium]|nr:xanthine dehydrogenase molybdopterin binding subunit [Gammaproteobacteria bacterium]NIR88826.1 xanthine dehydrogenase molybdopterin binding subunit [Gammaproteobacteria bacterium]NIU06430.1 xanthine dehydrogenase molybdopterin binding subunit [Gammaproteobacteria bacterium]NIV53322.1 xanthine dehydrogenase molybdopterin binding subunit [Gammaproteobacteria bacterium]NIV74041.1 xanthine dehydrogenase molybdopterin binding subunit [Gammaproteobacteria bacterium]